MDSPPKRTVMRNSNASKGLTQMTVFRVKNRLLCASSVLNARLSHLTRLTVRSGLRFPAILPDESELASDSVQTTGFQPGSYSRCQKAIAGSSSRMWPFSGLHLSVRCVR